MKGLFELSPSSAIGLAIDAIEYMNNFDIEPYKQTEERFSFLKLRKVKTTYYNCPFWYQEKEALILHFEKIKASAERAAKNGDKIFLSELSYTNSVMLINGNDRANPIYIRNY